MSVVTGMKLRRLPQEEFGPLAFDVMRDVFAMHAELGRFFDEKIYQRELARRRTDVRREVPVEVSFASFRKRYFLDAVVGEGGLFEFKAHEASAPRVAVKLTAFSEELDAFETHARRFFRHTALEAMLWINISRTHVTLTTLQ